jgi:epoxyqueuosine reductase QueG
MEYTEQLKDFIKSVGADLVGFTDVVSLQGIHTDPKDLLNSFSHVISVAVEVPKAVFDTILDRPTPIYSVVYQTINRVLDEIAEKTSRHLRNNGYSSLPIPASQVVDHENLYGAISHKAVARMAGLGWQGKNLLLITPQFGSRVRLVTILTNAPLRINTPIKNRCGACTECKNACPVGAIKGVETEDRYQNRNEALYFDRCASKLTEEFAELPDVDAPICGICIKVCPYGK